MDKLNIADLLKDCPRGMELNCTMYEDVYFEYIDELQIIHCYIERKLCKTSITFNQYGTPNSDVKSKCVIFPKGKTTWDCFHRPFKDGDVVVDSNGAIFLYRQIHPYYEEQYADFYCGLTSVFRSFVIKTGEAQRCGKINSIRLATEEEKQKLFDVIKANGYKWNVETKTLEKLKKDKFDITTLKPFDKVLVRLRDTDHWKPAFWGRRIQNHNFPFITSFGSTAQAIPFKGNEWLVGTTYDCDDFYKTW